MTLNLRQSLASLLVLLILTQTAQSYRYPNSQCCCGSIPGSKDSRYVFSDKDLNLLLHDLVPNIDTRDKVVYFLSRLPQSLRTSIWAKIKTSRKYFDTRKGEFGTPYLGQQLLTFCPDYKQNGRLLSEATAQINTRIFLYPYSGNIEGSLNYDVASDPQLLNMIYDYRQANRDDNFMMIQEPSDEQSNVEDQFEKMNNYYCSYGYARYIQEAYEQLKMGNFKNPENFFRVLIATLMPDKWGREMFIRWVAKIIDAIYGQHEHIADLICQEPQVPSIPQDPDRTYCNIDC